MRLYKSKKHQQLSFIVMACLLFSFLQCRGVVDGANKKDTDNQNSKQMRLFSIFKTPEQVKNLSVKEFKETIKDPDIQLVDVRTLEEFNAGTIDGAIQIDVSSSNFLEKAQKELDSSKPVALFCRSGARSMHAARLLANKGFPVVYNLKGGIIAWR